MLGSTLIVQFDSEKKANDVSPAVELETFRWFVRHHGSSCFQPVPKPNNLKSNNYINSLKSHARAKYQYYRHIACSILHYEVVRIKLLLYYEGVKVDWSVYRYVLCPVPCGLGRAMNQRKASWLLSLFDCSNFNVFWLQIYPRVLIDYWEFRD